MIVWAAWTPPRTARARVAFAVAVLEPCLFFVLVGSRTRVLAVALTLAVVTHYCWRRFRLREVAVAFVLGIVLAAALLGVRQATQNESFTRALSAAPDYIIHPRGAVNDLTQFDQLFYTTSSVGVTLPFRHGGWLVEALHSYVPRFIDPHKPEPPTSHSVRKYSETRWGPADHPRSSETSITTSDSRALLSGSSVGLLARMVLALLTGIDPRGRPFRIGLYSLSLFIFYEFLSTNYAIAIGFILTLVIQFLIAVFIFGRVRIKADHASPDQASATRRRERAENALID